MIEIGHLPKLIASENREKIFKASITEKIQHVMNTNFNEISKKTSKNYKADRNVAICEILRESTIASCLDDSAIQKIKNLLSTKQM